MSDMDIIRAGLRQNIESLARLFFPSGRVDGRRYWAPSSKRGKRDGSLCIDISGPTAGRWFDFSDDAAKGDPIDLIAFCEFGCYPPTGRKEAILWARRWLGLSEAQRVADIRAREASTPIADRPSADDRVSKDEKARKAKGWWLNCAALSGTHGSEYFRERSIDLCALPSWPQAFRFSPSLKHPNGRRYPGIVAAMCDDKGDIRAIHRTFLDAGRPVKADVNPAKMMWGDVKGTSIRVSKGRSRLSPEQAAKKGERTPRQVILEGPEDALNWALVYPEDRVTAAGSVALIASAPLFDCCNEILVVADNDAPDSAATRAIARAAHTLKRRAGGRPVSLIRPRTAKDINDLWRGAA